MSRATAVYALAATVEARTVPRRPPSGRRDEAPKS